MAEQKPELEPVPEVRVEAVRDRVNEFFGDVDWETAGENPGKVRHIKNGPVDVLIDNFRGNKAKAFVNGVMHASISEQKPFRDYELFGTGDVQRMDQKVSLSAAFVETTGETALRFMVENQDGVMVEEKDPTEQLRVAEILGVQT